MSDKVIQRRILLDARATIPAALKSAWDARIVAGTLEWLDSQSISTLGVYWSMRGEPDLGALYAQLATRGVQLALPVVDAADSALRFVAWAPGDDVVRDRMGVWVPVQGRTVAPQALLIPCVGFNAQRIRLGYGGGFYDRTLSAAQRPLAVGIAYASAAAEFEGEPHDVPLDLIITERD